MNKTILHIAKLLVALTIALGSPSKVFAHEGDTHDQEVCAAVHPCLENGEILPEFNTEGYCGEQYRLLCSKIKTSLLADELVSCQNDNAKFKDSETKLSKQIRSLRKKLSRSK